MLKPLRAPYPDRMDPKEAAAVINLSGKEERIAELEKELQDARVAIACLVEVAGGKVAIPEETLLRVSRFGPEAWSLAVRDEFAGGMTFTVKT